MVIIYISLIVKYHLSKSTKNSKIWVEYLNYAFKTISYQKKKTLLLPNLFLTDCVLTFTVQAISEKMLP